MRMKDNMKDKSGNIMLDLTQESSTTWVISPFLFKCAEDREIKENRVCKVIKYHTI